MILALKDADFQKLCKRLPEGMSKMCGEMEIWQLTRNYEKVSMLTYLHEYLQVTKHQIRVHTPTYNQARARTGWLSNGAVELSPLIATGSLIFFGNAWGMVDISPYSCWCFLEMGMSENGVYIRNEIAI